jgi:hypothetical protein
MGEKQSMNPWLKIWVQPRDTIRAIVKTNSKKYFALLSAFYGFPMLLQFSKNLSLGETLPSYAILIVALVLSTFAGMLGITIISWLVHWTGKWIGGEGNFDKIRAAVAWSNVPNAVNGLIWLAMIALFGERLFTRGFGEEAFVGTELQIVFFAFLAQVILAVWAFVILLKTVGEVQGFSAWKALLNILIPFFVVVIALWVLMWVYWLIFGMHNS